jgi:hypothetical protein
LIFARVRTLLHIRNIRTRRVHPTPERPIPRVPLLTPSRAAFSPPAWATIMARRCTCRSRSRGTRKRAAAPLILPGVRPIRRGAPPIHLEVPLILPVVPLMPPAVLPILPVVPPAVLPILPVVPPAVLPILPVVPPAAPYPSGGSPYPSGGSRPPGGSPYPSGTPSYPQSAPYQGQQSSYTRGHASPNYSPSPNYGQHAAPKVESRSTQLTLRIDFRIAEVANSGTCPSVQPAR